MAKRKKPKATTRKKAKPKPRPPFDVELVARLTDGSEDPVDIVRTLAGLGLSVPTAATLVGLNDDEFNDLLENTELGRVWDQAAALTDAEVSQQLLAKCREGNMPAIRLWLASRLPENVAPGKPARRANAEQTSDPANPFAGLEVVSE